MDPLPARCKNTGKIFCVLRGSTFLRVRGITSKNACIHRRSEVRKKKWVFDRPWAATSTGRKSRIALQFLTTPKSFFGFRAVKKRAYFARFLRRIGFFGMCPVNFDCFEPSRAFSTVFAWLGPFACLDFLMGRCAAHLVMSFDCFGAAFPPAGGSKSPSSRKMPSRTTLAGLPAPDWAQSWLLVLQKGRLGLRNPVFLSPGRSPA